MNKHHRSLSGDGAQTTPSKRPKLIEGGSSSPSPTTSPSASSFLSSIAKPPSLKFETAPQHGQDPSRSHELNSAITLGLSQSQDPQDQHQNVSHFFTGASDFQINHPTFIHVSPGSDTATLPFPDSRDGRKLKKVLLEGLEFSLLAQECMQDTRVTILSDVDARIRDNEESNIIWIKGFPGVGKSALASTIVSRLRGRGQLLSYFVFDRAKPTVTTTRALWRRVAWDLAHLYPAVRPSLLKRIDDKTLDINTPNISSLFTSLISEPLSELNKGESSDVQLDQPVVVVIDAADECGGLEGPRSSDRKALLKTLEQWHSELPKNFKLVITSREEDDIKRRISPISTHIHVSITTDEASSDIRKYLEDRLGDIASAYTELPVDWPHHTAKYLTTRAAGVFIWATTIANFIEAGEPQSQLEDIDAGLGLGGEEGSLYALYANVLKISFKNLHGKQAEAFKSVVGAMIFAQRPFHDSEFTAISPVVTGSMLEYIRNGLRSVIDHGATLRFVHQSFVDFLLSPECPGEFAIREAEQQHQLSSLCLITMSKQLRFNICGLVTSSLKNVDVPDIEDKVRAHIPSLLSYTSCFVTDHLRHTAFDERLLDGLRMVFKEKLLYWLEAMSLLKEMNRTVPILRAVLDWTIARDEDLTEFVRDALRFVAAFSIPIAQSAPHIYLSALPFSPEQSLVAEYFLPRFPRLLTLTTGKPDQWSPCIFVSEPNKKSLIEVIAFSRDEKSFASGSGDGICIWDSETGIQTAGPFIRSTERESCIQALDFSADGKFIVAAYGDKGAAVWDVESGKECFCLGEIWESRGASPLHSPYSLSLQSEVWEEIVSAVYSKDGNTIVSASRYFDVYDRPLNDESGPCRIQLWDASTGALAHILLDVSTSNSDYLLSPDTRFLASQNNLSENPLEVWDLTERPPRRVIELDADYFFSLVFSADGNCLLAVTSTTEDVWIARMWRMDTCTPVGPPLVLGPYADLAYHTLFSCGNDNLEIGVHSKVSTKIFDATTGDIVYCGKEPTPVSCASPSRSGRKTLLGYDDGTIRMWDYQCHTQVLPEIDSTTNNHPKFPDTEVESVFSPCGRILAVICGDEIELWSTTTGEAINLRHPIRTKSDMLAFSADGRYIVSIMIPGGRHGAPLVVDIWDASTGLNHRHLVVTWVHDSFHLFFASNGNRLVICDTGSRSGGGWEIVMHIWGDDMFAEPCTTVTLLCSSSSDGRVPTVLLSPDTLIALIVERTYTGTISHCHRRSSIKDQFTPDVLFDTASLGIKIPLWPKKTVFSPSGQLFAFVPDNSILVSQIHIRETKTWTEVAGPFKIAELSVLHQGPFGGRPPMLLSISRDDRFIHFADSRIGAIWVWDIRTGCLVTGPQRGYNLGQALSIIISPDGNKLATTSYDPTTIRLWDTRGLCSEQPQELVGGIGNFGDQSLIEDGWVMGEGSDQLLFWVPAEHRDGLWWPRNIAIIGVTLTKLDFSRFKHGKEWEVCIDEGYAARTQAD